MFDLLPNDLFLTGYIASGKDFVANQLVAQAGYTRLSFADALKQEVASFAGITVGELNQRKADFRAVLQTVGVSRRKADENYWIGRWEAARAFISGPVVCADVRFPNEAQFARLTRGLLLRVSVPEEERRRRVIARDGVYNPDWAQHESERYVSTLPVDGELSGLLAPAEIVPAIRMQFATKLRSNAVHEYLTWRT